MEHTFDAFVFDLDGTLVDSAAIADRVMRNWCDEHRINFQAVRSAHSARIVDTVREVAPHLDAALEADKIEEQERKLLVDLKEIEGASALLKKVLHEKWAVATSSDTMTARMKLKAAGLPLPQVLIGADQVLQGKPQPEAYLKAAEALGCSVKNCLAFEDSESGIRSALSAGCSVVFVGSTCEISDPKILAHLPNYMGIEVLERAFPKLDIRWNEEVKN